MILRPTQGFYCAILNREFPVEIRRRFLEKYDAMKLFGTKRNAAHYQKKRSRGRKVLLVLLVLALLLTGGAYAVFTWFITPPPLPDIIFNPPRPGPVAGPGQEPPEVLERGEVFTIMIAGQDNVGEIGLTDTLMLVLVDSETQTVNVVSFPRDTLIDMDWGQKINAVFPLTGSVERLRDEVGRMIGFRPDFYITLNLQAFSQLVDTLGGVWFDVPMTMIYDDPYDIPPLHIFLTEGYQQLTGAQAIQLVRFRQDNFGFGPGDFGRMEIQQNFLRAIAAELLQARNITRINSLAQIFIDYVDTDMTLGNLIWLATQFTGMDSEDINFFTMPGEEATLPYSGSYVILDLDAWLEMVNSYLNPLPVPITEENVRVYTWVYGALQLVGGDMPLTGEQ